MKPIYLDYNTTAPLVPSVLDAMQPYWIERFGDPDSGGLGGLVAMEALEQARERVAGLLGAQPDEIIFTSGGTEANNLAIKGVMFDPSRWDHRGQPRGHLVVSGVEHPSVAQSANYLTHGPMAIELTVVPPLDNGRIDPAHVAAALRPDTWLVSVIHADQHSGVVQPIDEIASICRQHDVLLHTDASQTIGKVRTRVDQLPVDLLTLSGHKIYGPRGVGALYARRGTRLSPMMHGGDQEMGLRAGAVNIVGVVGLAHAATMADKSVEEFSGRIRGLRDRLWDGLVESIPGVEVLGERDELLPNTLCARLPNVSAESIRAGVPELTAAAAPADAVARLSDTITLSLGWPTTSEEIERAIQLLADAWRRLIS